MHERIIIKLAPETWWKLRKLGRKGQSYDEIINDLIRAKEDAAIGRNTNEEARKMIESLTER